MKPGMSLQERRTERGRYRERAIAAAARTGLTLRCRELQDDMDNPGHRFCKGESPGGSGCLCRCHDPLAEMVS